MELTLRAFECPEWPNKMGAGMSIDMFIVLKGTVRATVIDQSLPGPITSSAFSSPAVSVCVPGLCFCLRERGGSFPKTSGSVLRDNLRGPLLH